MRKVSLQHLCFLIKFKKIQHNVLKNLLHLLSHSHVYLQTWINHLTQLSDKLFKLKLQMGFIQLNKQVTIHHKVLFIFKEKTILYMVHYNLLLRLESIRLMAYFMAKSLLILKMVARYLVEF
jgi:hypothetical protein